MDVELKPIVKAPIPPPIYRHPTQPPPPPPVVAPEVRTYRRHTHIPSPMRRIPPRAPLYDTFVNRNAVSPVFEGGEEPTQGTMLPIVIGPYQVVGTEVREVSLVSNTTSIPTVDRYPIVSKPATIATGQSSPAGEEQQVIRNVTKLARSTQYPGRAVEYTSPIDVQSFSISEEVAPLPLERSLTPTVTSEIILEGLQPSQELPIVDDTKIVVTPNIGTQ